MIGAIGPENVAIDYFDFDFYFRSNQISLTTIDGNSMTFQGPHVQELHAILDSIISELKKKSIYVVATKNYTPTGKKIAFISAKKAGTQWLPCRFLEAAELE